MSTTKSTIPHLTQEPLSSNDQKILAGIEDWTCKAKFEKMNVDNFELCVDDGLSGPWTLLKDMDLVREVWHDILKLASPLTHTLVSNPPMVDHTNTRSQVLAVL